MLASAQFDKNNAIYTTTEINVGNYFGFDFNLNYVYNEEYSVRLGYTGNIRKPISEPQNFSSGFVGIFFLGLGRPFDHFDSYEVCLGKIIKLDEKGIYRVNLSLLVLVILQYVNQVIGNPFMIQYPSAIITLGNSKNILCIVLYLIRN